MEGIKEREHHVIAVPVSNSKFFYDGIRDGDSFFYSQNHRALVLNILQRTLREWPGEVVDAERWTRQQAREHLARIMAQTFLPWKASREEIKSAIHNRWVFWLLDPIYGGITLHVMGPYEIKKIPASYSCNLMAAQAREIIGL